MNNKTLLHFLVDVANLHDKYVLDLFYLKLYLQEQFYQDNFLLMRVLLEEH